MLQINDDEGMNDVYLGDTYNTEDVSFTERQVLVCGAGKVVPGYTLSSWRPDCLIKI